MKLTLTESQCDIIKDKFSYDDNTVTEKIN